jgi:predicted class III extradiol MEMO1 family dioxygenase
MAFWSYSFRGVQFALFIYLWFNDYWDKQCLCVCAALDCGVRHAGYSYSGRAAAYAFGNIDPSNM